MEYTTLGRTGLRVSVAGLGCGGFSQLGLGSGKTEADAIGIIRGAVEFGVNLFDTAAAYGTEPVLGKALKGVPRDQVIICTKAPFGVSNPNSPPERAVASLDRSLRELDTDYIDIVLMHVMMSDDWTTRYRRTMDVLSEAKAKGWIRAHGCSCHSIGALRAAAASPWVEVDLVRMNPAQLHMDADPKTVLTVIREMRAKGKGVVGMKILGQGELRDRPDDALHFALSLGTLDAFTIGAENIGEQKDLIRRIAAVRV